MSPAAALLLDVRAVLQIPDSRKKMSSQFKPFHPPSSWKFPQRMCTEIDRVLSILTSHTGVKYCAVNKYVGAIGFNSHSTTRHGQDTGRETNHCLLTGS